jgi:PAS domain S-box-containing protein
LNTPNPPFGTPNSQLLESIYKHLPVLVVVLTANGRVLYANPAAVRVTGYPEAEFLGQNFWSLLFPGRLFAQVPRFISAVHPAGLLASDVAMVIKTRDGEERVVAWSRINQERAGLNVPGPTESAPAIICFGTDLTDRLNAADAETAAGSIRKPGENLATSSENPPPVDGDIVTPLAISPPILTGDNGNPLAAIQQVHEFLTSIEERVEALETAFSQGEMGHLAGIAAGLQSGAHACGLLSFSTRAEQLHAAASRGALEQVSTLVQQIVTMVKPERE